MTAPHSRSLFPSQALLRAIWLCLFLGAMPIVSMSSMATAKQLMDEIEEVTSSNAAGEIFAEVNAANLQPLLGYDEGFVIASREATDLRAGEAPFLLKFNGWGQFRITSFLSANESQDFNQLQLKRARLLFSGHAFTSDFAYMIALDGRSSDNNDIRLLDYFLSYDLGHHAFQKDQRALMVKLGQYKIPFSLARFLSAQHLQFTDRSVANMFFDANRSLAMGLYGEGRPGGQKATWEIAVFNGLVTGGAETGTSGALDNNFAYSARVSAFPQGEWGADELSDFEFHVEPATRIGAALARSRIGRIGSTEFNSLRVVDSGERLGSILPPETEEYLVTMYSLDASVKYRGFTLTSEYYFRNINDFVGIIQPDLFDHGFSLETGYYVLPQKLELLARWSRVIGESGSLGSRRESSDERALGAVWYFRRHAAKLTVDATYLDGAPIESFALDIDPGATGWLMRTQMQFSF